MGSSFYPSSLRRFRRASSALLGVSSPNDPVLTSPARSYEAMITPLGEISPSRSLNPAGFVPSANNRLPLPRVTGNIFSQSSSTKSCFKRVWIRLLLPWTCISGPSCSFILLISFKTSPLTSSELLQSSFVSVFEDTYFFALLNLVANGSSLVFTYGQCAANISYVFLPSNKSKGLLICFSNTVPRKSSRYPTIQPSCLKPPVGSSSGPPGACITPSRDMNERTISFLILFHPVSRVRQKVSYDLQVHRQVVGYLRHTLRVFVH